MGAFQMNLAPNVVVHLGAVYVLPSGRYVRVLNQVGAGWFVETVSPRDMTATPAGAMTLTGYFIYMYGRMCWTGMHWAARVAQVAEEAEAVRILREKRVIAAEQDIARAKVIDAEYASKKVAELSERAANRAIMRLAA